MKLPFLPTFRRFLTTSLLLKQNIHKVQISFFTGNTINLSKMSSSDESSDAAPKVWTPPPVIEDLFGKTAGNQFAAINAPTAGARVQQELPKGDAPLQLHSLATPNGHKVLFYPLQIVFVATSGKNITIAIILCIPLSGIHHARGTWRRL